MSVHFTKEGLVDEYGWRIDISYADLSKACLKDEYATIRIREIIIGAIEQILDQKIVVNNYYNNSDLYIRLEQEIQQHPEYQASKKEFRQKAERRKAGRPPKEDNYSRAAARFFKRQMIERRSGRLYW